ncbi:DNA-processing protein DprA [Tenacibaculum finnmarkense]|uniref:DNA-processing protein DprA n=1 Tax=Tenacibaculum finnmarkense TaxID=2781243 RepID=UPI001E59AC74|nr:DNA-processing protein DprA [Tenacibaculum finnmarkense]MCD8399468.1 DNA-processing protein DprA [Tenacibaculum finnmarkense genomovar ulcerans]MCD8421466.1 DNA-processing protein DprA [Tenacibaculum finnmarkense genomovar ulcerans]MCG8237598.1 DNA-processing protein DprA [Tenacibaculum finnmarkense genomovar ulcerans]MCG8784963.1 DNA-protecting protein DprA [Tenacibaculum finnmarkense]MCG8812571.1 DNA-protecting protein DprA [Tenacibaculum finnmarkense]
MNSDKIIAILRLQSTKNIGDIIAKKLITATGSVEQIFKEKAGSLQKINGIGAHTIQQLLNTENIKKATEEFEYIKKNNIQYSYFLDADYPQNLKNCIDAPILFFKDGAINLNSQKIISIVGTRKITPYGRDFCKQLLANLAPYNPIIISGFAYGIDICAHKAAIENNLQTIGVLAHGLEMIYPKTHKKYCAQVTKNGGFITDFWHKEQPLRENFLKRNRIVAGISKATIVIESAAKGGSLVTADIANSYNRDVFAVPGRTYDIYSKGCNNLIKNNQAHLLNTADDIIKMLNWDVNESKNTTAIQNQLFVTLSDDEQKIYDFLNQNGKQLFDVIAHKCEIPVYKLSSLVLQMELKGVLRPLPGKLFEV